MFTNWKKKYEDTLAILRGKKRAIRYFKDRVEELEEKVKGLMKQMDRLAVCRVTYPESCHECHEYKTCEFLKSLPKEPVEVKEKWIPNCPYDTQPPCGEEAIGPHCATCKRVLNPPKKDPDPKAEGLGWFSDARLITCISCGKSPDDCKCPGRKIKPIAKTFKNIIEKYINDLIIKMQKQGIIPEGCWDITWDPLEIPEPKEPVEGKVCKYCEKPILETDIFDTWVHNLEPREEDYSHENCTIINELVMVRECPYCNSDKTKSYPQDRKGIWTYCWNPKCRYYRVVVIKDGVRDSGEKVTLKSHIPGPTGKEMAESIKKVATSGISLEPKAGKSMIIRPDTSFNPDIEAKWEKEEKYKILKMQEEMEGYLKILYPMLTAKEVDGTFLEVLEMAERKRVDEAKGIIEDKIKSLVRQIQKNGHLPEGDVEIEWKPISDLEPKTVKKEQKIKEFAKKVEDMENDRST